MKQAFVVSNNREVPVDLILEPLCEKKTLESGKTLKLRIKFIREPTDISETLEISFDETAITVYATNVADVDWE